MSPHVMKKLAKPMLFAAAIIWGTSFFVMKNALDVIPVFYLLAIRFTAVSYTHLDVYKRQSRNCSGVSSQT